MDRAAKLRAFVAYCVAAQDDARGPRYGWRTMRSLRVDDDPDGTCWLADDGWWLSTAAPEEG